MPHVVRGDESQSVVSSAILGAAARIAEHLRTPDASERLRELREAALAKGAERELVAYLARSL